ncbi:MAG TPA: TIGR02444 family protein [Stellaceae bacterium]|nr:TIGR02444 family protein [Stellaceae bacterium]
MAGRTARVEGFWRFSLMVYARPGVADALIRLQDQAGHNVNLILFGLWLGLCEGVRLDTAGLARAVAAIAGIDGGVVTPLRRLRRGLRSDPASDVQDLRRRVLSLELAAERGVQARLAASAGRRHSRSGDLDLVKANLRLILGSDFGSEAAAMFLKSACR